MFSIFSKISNLINPSVALAKAQEGDTLAMSLDLAGTNIHVPVKVTSVTANVLNVFVESDTGKVAFYFDRAGNPRLEVQSSARLHPLKNQAMADTDTVVSSFFT